MDKKKQIELLNEEIKKELMSYGGMKIEKEKICLFYKKGTNEKSKGAVCFTHDGGQLQYLSSDPEVVKQFVANPSKFIRERDFELRKKEENLVKEAKEGIKND